MVVHLSHSDWRSRAARVRMMAFDVDGVLTDGRLYFGADGDAMKAFHVRDGAGLQMLLRADIQVALITGRDSPIVTRRAENLGITLLRQGVRDKAAVYAEMLAAHGLDFSQAGFMGDDLIDLSALTASAFAAAPPDAHPSVQAVCHYVSPLPAGAGAARDVCERLLEAQGKLAPLLPSGSVG